MKKIAISQVKKKEQKHRRNKLYGVFIESKDERLPNEVIMNKWIEKVPTTTTTIHKHIEFFIPAIIYILI